MTHEDDIKQKAVNFTSKCEFINHDISVRSRHKVGVIGFDIYSYITIVLWHFFLSWLF